MTLESHLINRFCNWRPTPPSPIDKSKSHVILDLQQKEFQYLKEELLYKVEKRERIPEWVVVFCGSDTRTKIDYLAPCSPHKFRLKVILKASAVPYLAEKAKEYYGNEDIMLKELGLNIVDENRGKRDFTTDKVNIDDDDASITQEESCLKCPNEKIKGENGVHIEDGTNCKGTIDLCNEQNVNSKASGDTKATDVKRVSKQGWLESQWSEEAWASTDSDGTSASCFCMAVRGGYLKQMQMMLDERPPLIGIINSTNGFTPLATAVMKGDLSTVGFLVCSGAEVNQRCSSEQTALQLAVLRADCNVAGLLVGGGADVTIRDRNGLRAEHYAADSNSVDMMALVLRHGGDLHVKDNNGWTPLFRAVVQGSSPAMVELLVSCGSDVTVIDRAGLSLASAARLVKNSHTNDNRRDTIIRLVDKQYPHELAVANFLKLTKKISRVHTMFNTQLQKR